MWVIRCTDEQCGQVTYAAQIDELIGQHRDDAGWFLCGLCGKHGYIEKSFARQEGEGQTWAPFLKGAIKLEYPDDTYRPFAFLVGRTADDGEVDSVWVSYYKDSSRIRRKARRWATAHGLVRLSSSSSRSRLSCVRSWAPDSWSNRCSSHNRSETDTFAHASDRCSLRDHLQRPLSTFLPMGVRLVMIKMDGSVQVHSDGGGSKAKPQNWMTAPTAIEIDGRSARSGSRYESSTAASCSRSKSKRFSPTSPTRPILRFRSRRTASSATCRSCSRSVLSTAARGSASCAASGRPTSVRST